MNLVNDNTEATLLAGNDVNINGTVNVTGDVRTHGPTRYRRLSININTAGQPLRLAGGSLGDPNMLLGGTISGAGSAERRSARRCKALARSTRQSISIPHRICSQTTGR